MAPKGEVETVRWSSEKITIAMNDEKNKFWITRVSTKQKYRRILAAGTEDFK